MVLGMEDVSVEFVGRLYPAVLVYVLLALHIFVNEVANHALIGRL